MMCLSYHSYKYWIFYLDYLYGNDFMMNFQNMITESDLFEPNTFLTSLVIMMILPLVLFGMAMKSTGSSNVKAPVLER